MGIYDRDYMADEKKGFGVPAWSVVTWLIVANVAFFLVQHVVFNNRIYDALSVSKEALLSGQVWRLVTFQFAHGHGFHLLGNMLLLFFLGRVLEQIQGSRVILPLYLLGGLAGGLGHAIFHGFVLGQYSTVIGASASVLAIAMALIITIPEQRFSLLFLPIQFKIKYLGWFLLGANVLGLLLTLTPTGGEQTSYISHLAGMAVGWFFVRNGLPWWQKRQDRQRTVDKPKSVRSRISQAAEERIKEKREKESVYLSKRVDAILEKISEQGMQSLTDEERKILERSSEKLSKKLDDK